MNIRSFTQFKTRLIAYIILSKYRLISNMSMNYFSNKATFKEFLIPVEIKNKIYYDLIFYNKIDQLVVERSDGVYTEYSDLFEKLEFLCRKDEFLLKITLTRPLKTCKASSNAIIYIKGNGQMSIHCHNSEGNPGCCACISGVRNNYSADSFTSKFLLFIEQIFIMFR